MPRIRSFLFIVAISLVAVACGGADRPDAATWLAEWTSIMDIIPDQSELGDPPDEDVCQQTLATLRSETDVLFPAPSASIDDLAEQWATLAESAFFDCPPEGESISSFDDAYAELHRIEEAVESALTVN